MNLADFTKRKLQSRGILFDVFSFCDKHGIVIPEMDEKYGLGQ